MKSVEREFMITSEMIDAYEDLIGEKRTVRKDETRRVPNGLITALVHDTVWRTLGDGAVCVAMSLTHIASIKENSKIKFALVLTSGSDSMGQYLLTIGSDSFYSVGNVTVKVFK